MLNALTIDVEDYFQVANFQEVIRYENWGRFQIRVTDSTYRIMDILDEADVKATFFVLGWLAERLPGLVKDISRRGHEVASHGYNHKLIYKQTKQQFRDDIRNTKIILEDITGKEVYGYRAPSYSITENSLWALKVLVEEGYKYDSSIFPVRHHRYGLTTGERHIHKILPEKNKTIWEFPPSTLKIGNINFPIAGGGYFRLLPLPFVNWGIKQINKEGAPAVMYLHPWEIDKEQPKIKVGFLLRFRHYVNIGRAESKLKALINEHAFSSIVNVLREQLSGEV